MANPDPDRRQPYARDTFERSSWWPFVGAVLGALGCYAVLIVHLVLEATNADAWGLMWMVLPGVLFSLSVGALFIGSGMTARQRVAAVGAAILGRTPRNHLARHPSTAARNPGGSVE